MVKKESAKRGYMTRAEVEGHLKDFKTTNGKIGYVNDILSAKQQSLVSSQTRDNLHAILPDLYVEAGDFGSAARGYSDIGEHKMAAIAHEKDGDFLEAARQWETAHDLKKAAINFKKSGNEDDIPSMYLRNDKKNEAVKVYTELERFGNAAEIYLDNKEWEMAAISLEKEADKITERHNRGISQFGLRPNEVLYRASKAWEKVGNLKKAEKALKKADRGKDVPEMYLRHDKKSEAAEAYLKEAISGHRKKSDIINASELFIELDDFDSIGKILQREGINGVYGLKDYYLKTAEDLANSGKIEDASSLYESLAMAHEANKGGIEAKNMRLKIKGLKRSKLEKLLTSFLIIGVLAGIFFLSPNMTGNAIADLSTKTSSFLGVGLLIIALIAGFYLMNGKKKKTTSKKK